ncbi:mechanosensitive ion channel family protein [Varunaivibrio sulfuroxidans]|uniref:Small-conductance mechanosensitive channel n=1 Tax=Varunaivibrio sulfuroxidans TaxID=1773489 RepID=A0A4R3JAA8_9PROT|nr:mechanosensitive ion channel domain-containing protein [Varunaivibrio sulfuroxidans]TCS62477.1 small conductance mechanosensitive channel [Varunaivibrio sulfuroxidans]WES30850.1 mechanosensitive ion channel [Varunaivibrio sulfuroxidans]
MNGQAEYIVNGAQKAIEQIVQLMTQYGLNVLGAIVILILGLWIARRGAHITQAALRRTKRIDETLVTFFSSIVQYTIITFTALAVLSQFGVQTASLLTVLGAAGLAVGLALQGTLSNVAAGVMLLIFRPFKVGDFIDVAGKSGTVNELNLFFTMMATVDNIRVILPNSQVWGSALSNFSTNPTRRVDLLIGVSYGDNIDKAMGVIKDIIARDERIHKEPEPLVAVFELGESSVNIVIRVWTSKDDFWALKFALTKAIKEGFDANAITIPFPTRTLVGAPWKEARDRAPDAPN